jgi:hypothetical protein
LSGSCPVKSGETDSFTQFLRTGPASEKPDTDPDRGRTPIDFLINVMN